MSHFRVPYDNEEFKGATRNVKHVKKKKAKMVVFKRDGSPNTLFSRKCERLSLFLRSDMTGYLMKPIRVNEDLKESSRNVKNGPK